MEKNLWKLELWKGLFDIDSLSVAAFKTLWQCVFHLMSPFSQRLYVTELYNIVYDNKHVRLSNVLKVKYKEIFVQTWWLHLLLLFTSDVRYCKAPTLFQLPWLPAVYKRVYECVVQWNPVLFLFPHRRISVLMNIKAPAVTLLIYFCVNSHGSGLRHLFSAH